MSPATWVTTLGRASVEAAVLVIAVAVLLRFVPRLHPGARASVWWLVSLRALTGCLGLPSLPLPLLPARALTPLPFVEPSAAAVQPAAVIPLTVMPMSAAPAVTVDPWWLAGIALVVLWGAGCVVMVVRQARGVARVLGMWGAASPLASSRVRGWLADWLGDSGGERVEVRTSAAVRAPMILSWGRPRILLPAFFAVDATQTARMALAHEASHLHRRDLWWGWVPALADCVFWFHPMIRWAVREYVQAREEACDEHAIRLTGAEPAGYGEMLIGFGVDRARVGHAAASCGSPHARHLKRRLEMLSHSVFQSRGQRALALATVFAFGLLTLIPMRLVAAGSAPPAPPPAPAPPAGNAGTATPSGPVAAKLPPPPAPVAAVARDDAPEAADGKSHEIEDPFVGMGWSDDDGHEFSFGLMTDGNQTFSGTFGDGDWDRVRRIHRKYPGRLFWFYKDGNDYVVRDRATWDEAHDLLRPLRELGAGQAEQGVKQSELGVRQAELGTHQAELGARQARLSAEMSVLSTRLSIEDAQSNRRELRDQMESMRRKVRDLSREQHELSQQQSRLSAEQSALGRRQKELGARQRFESERVRVAIRELADRCIDDGRAERWKE